MHDDPLTLSAQEAAAALNISVATLYSYVSRKKLRAEKPAGSRTSRYLRTEVERLGGGAASGHAPGPLASSSVSVSTQRGISYRGVSALDLSRDATLEQVAGVLWQATDDPFQSPALPPPAGWTALRAATSAFPPLDRIAMLLPALEASDLRAHDSSPAGLRRSGANVLRWAAAIAVGLPAPPPGPIHAWLAGTFGCGPALEDVIRRVLVLAADQGLEPSTYAVRATANTGATPYRCVMSGLAAGTGARLPSLRTGAYRRFIQEIDTAADPGEPVLVRVREGEALPGFGYTPAVFHGTDPRATSLWAAMRHALSDDARFRRLERALALATEITGHQPEFAFLAAWVSLSVSRDSGFNLVRLGRIAGWLAHAFEQQLSAPLVRFT